ncbi:MAG: HAD-IIIA family hydrolase [Flavipsychrobacter sp.]|nr:HAD-IIIA family hydrolase [Flavipsychrobacter sp.]
MENSFHTQQQPDRGWTLFLDRDGVINEEIVGSYITTSDEFKFCNGALDALNILGSIFGTIVVVTNQRGVGKGIMSIEALRDINDTMTNAVTSAGGRLDKIYSCTAVSDTDHNRKPNTGMGLQAREDFPEIDFRKSIIVGNSLSDMEFGKRLAMHTVFLTTKHEPFELPNDLIDQQFSSLLDWARTLKVAPEVVG